MIELKNVNKVYRSKKFNNTIALKDVSIKFQEKGLVFILGKSGSGKSTLLNIIGGLEQCDRGEIIINGKSTKEFKEKEFDAYRNTYMGFVFQEYNLLENYSIEENIKLSLELQHKKATKEEIENALELVELGNISKRKTNELSGGQKQRVAIARALIKNPEIILADEPTGNLDTQTSARIWNILKKLSETKLVIVVSHDVEIAEKYADRIIRIQDGRIISDEGEKGSAENKEFKLKSAKLPFFYSFKMGLGSLVHKKIRLIFSTLLITFSLICFGVMLSAYSSDLNKEVIAQFEQNGPTDVSISKYKTTINSIEMMKAEMNPETDIDELMEKYESIEIDEEFKKEVEKNTGLNWESVYYINSINGIPQMIYPTSLQSEENYPLYYYVGNYGLSINFREANDVTIENLIGNKPQNADEIVISSYLADNIIYRGCMAKDKNDEKINEEKYQPKDYNELITSGKYINFCDIAYLKVVGIMDNSERLQKFSDLKQKKLVDWEFDENEEFGELYSGLVNEIGYRESYVYVDSSFINNMKNVKNTYSTITNIMNYNDQQIYGQVIAYIDDAIDICTSDGVKNISSLNSDEIVINEAILNEITNFDYETAYEENKNKYSTKEKFLVQYLKANEIIGQNIKSNIYKNNRAKSSDEYGTYKIIGVLLEYEVNNYTNMAYYAKSEIEALLTGNVYFESLVKKVNSTDEMEKILKYYPIDNSDALSSCEYSDKVLQAASISYFISFVAKYGVVFFLIFSTIILMNFINSSIRFRKKEIGTLRALGCRSIDIIKMFLYESFLLMIIALIISFAVIPNIVNAVNSFIVKNLFIDINVLRFGMSQILEITVLMFVIIILSNVIPIRKITKMKPIDAILNK